MTIEEFENKYKKSLCQNVNTISSYLNSGDVFLDIGANTGMLSEQIISNVKLSKAILIEPIQAYYEECLKKFSDNPIVEVEKIGFSDENVIKNFLCSKINFGYNKIYDYDMEIHPHFIEDVLCKRFSDWVGNRRIDFIKIDAEGHDIKIIEGMLPWLDELDSVPFILFEGEWNPDEENRISNLLSQKYSYIRMDIGRDILMLPRDYPTRKIRGRFI
jgi:FkbM family methyltransferase